MLFTLVLVVLRYESARAVCLRSRAAASLVAPACEVRSGPATAVGLEEGRDTSGRGRRLWLRFDGCTPARTSQAPAAFASPGTARTEVPTEMLSLAVVAGALLLRLGSAAPPRAPARGGIKLSSCPRGGSRPAAAHDDSEAGIETFARDYELTTSYGNGSTCGAQAGENCLDGAFPRRAVALSLIHI